MLLYTAVTNTIRNKDKTLLVVNKILEQTKIYNIQLKHRVNRFIDFFIEKGANK